MTHGLLGFASHCLQVVENITGYLQYTQYITLLYINNGPDLVWRFPTKHIYIIIYIYCTNICIYIYIIQTQTYTYTYIHIYIYMMSSYHLHIQYLVHASMLCHTFLNGMVSQDSPKPSDTRP